MTKAADAGVKSFAHPRMKKFANELLPVLRPHLEHVKALKVS